MVNLYVVKGTTCIVVKVGDGFFFSHDGLGVALIDGFWHVWDSNLIKYVRPKDHVFALFAGNSGDCRKLGEELAEIPETSLLNYAKKATSVLSESKSKDNSCFLLFGFEENEPQIWYADKSGRRPIFDDYFVIGPLEDGPAKKALDRYLDFKPASTVDQAAKAAEIAMLSECFAYHFTGGMFQIHHMEDKSASLESDTLTDLKSYYRRFKAFEESNARSLLAIAPANVDHPYQMVFLNIRYSYFPGQGSSFIEKLFVHAFCGTVRNHYRLYRLTFRDKQDMTTVLTSASAGSYKDKMLKPFTKRKFDDNMTLGIALCTKQILKDLCSEKSGEEWSKV